MTHKNLEVWKESINLVLDIYKITKDFPKEEIYGLTNQVRRSSVSIPSNIAEGCARQTPKETIQFLHVALGSIAELETQLIIANELNYASINEFFFERIGTIKKLLVGLIKFHKGKI